MRKLLLLLILAFCAFGVSAQGVKRGTYAEVFAPVMKAQGAFTVPLKLINAQRTQIISYQFNLHYDPNVITPDGPNFGCDQVGTLSEHMSVFCNVSPAGTLRVAVFDAYGFAGSGLLLNLRFVAVGSGESPLHFTEAFIHEGDPASIWYDGLAVVE